MREAHIFPLRSHAHLQAIKVGTSALWEGSPCLFFIDYKMHTVKMFKQVCFLILRKILQRF